MNEMLIPQWLVEIGNKYKVSKNFHEREQFETRLRDIRNYVDELLKSQKSKTDYWKKEK